MEFTNNKFKGYPNLILSSIRQINESDGGGEMHKSLLDLGETILVYIVGNHSIKLYIFKII